MHTVQVAFQFLTILPWRGNKTVSPAMLGRATAFFPLVGFVIGLILILSAWGLTRFLPSPVAALFLLSVWVVLTGALHLDGFLDTCDGLFGGHTPEERLRIMRDECVGAFALAGGVLLLLAKHASLNAILSAMPPLPGTSAFVVLRPLFLPPTLGRLAMTLALVAFPYGREEGVGRALKAHATWKEAFVAVVTGAVVATGVGGTRGLLLLAQTVLITWGLSLFVLRRVPGLTGDVYGALCEVVETSVLLAILPIPHLS